MSRDLVDLQDNKENYTSIYDHLGLVVQGFKMRMYYLRSHAASDAITTKELIFSDVCMMYLLRLHKIAKITQLHKQHLSGPLRISIQSAYLLEDSYNQLRMRLNQDLIVQLIVHFQSEEGIDASGLTREWYQLQSRVIFDRGALLFTTVGNNATFQPNRNVVYQTKHLLYFKFVGCMNDVSDITDLTFSMDTDEENSFLEWSDTITTVEVGHETTETASANLDTQIHSVEAYKIEIVKSIVFGGLAESVTSLSVVASATGGDTSTLNILILARANLIGGLFIMFHNIWDLKRDRFEQASKQIMEKYVDRYREQLGQRENFTVHVVFVVLIYIIFGLVPPVIYGFSFCKSNDKDLKIVAVAAASLVCILMLATGKAYAQKAPKPYFKTISAYIILGFTILGVSYEAGILFKRLLEKLGLFQPSSPANLFLPEIPGTGATWESL